MLSHTIDVIGYLNPPENVTELHLSRGLWNVFMSFVPNFAHIAAPLNKNLRKEKPATFETLHEIELLFSQALQEKITSPPFLALQRSQGCYKSIQMSVKTRWAVLLKQKSDGHDKPTICYCSRSPCRGMRLRPYPPGIVSHRVSRPCTVTVLGRLMLHYSNRR